MIQKITFFVAAFVSLSAQADFGEVDIVVRETVELFSEENDLELDVNTLLYKGSETFKVQGNTAIVTSFVQSSFSQYFKCITRMELPGMTSAFSTCEVTDEFTP